jgi:hypothetical protein
MHRHPPVAGKLHSDLQRLARNECCVILPGPFAFAGAELHDRGDIIIDAAC